MNLSNSNWSVRLFFWSLNIINEFTNFYYDTPTIKHKGTNLCFFMRSIIVYLPLIFIAHLICLLLIANTLIIYPIHLMGVNNFEKLLVDIFIGIVITLIIYIIFILISNSLDMLPTIPKLHWPKVLKRKPKQPINRGPSFSYLFIMWVVNQKKKICPIISFTNEDHNNA